ncbi:MAG: HAD-IB family hydrolase [Ferruginibacter sp.]
MQKSIAFFDFDGTITTKDTMLEFVRFCKGTFSYYAGMVAISPWLLSMKFGLVSKAKAKEKLLSHFFAGTPIVVFNNNCQSFSEQVLPRLIKKNALDTITKLQAENTPVIIVSASAENWVKFWCLQNDVQLIATRLVTKDDKITGELDGKNCNGKEKVNRIKELFDPADYEIIYCYGDTSGDKMMLQLATEPYYRAF